MCRSSCRRSLRLSLQGRLRCAVADLDVDTTDIALVDSGDMGTTQDPVQQDALLRLKVRRGSCVWDPTFGSRLASLARTKVNARFAQDLESEVLECLKPLTLTGEVANITFQHQRLAGRWECRVAFRTRTQTKTSVRVTLEVS